MSEDSKMLFSVAALVVAGAVGVALVASCDSGSSKQTPAVEQASRTAAPERPAAEPFDVTPMPFAETASESASVTVSGADPAPPVMPAETFQVEPDADRVARGLETYRAREYDRSAAYFAAEAAERPERAWTHYMLGLALWKSGELDEAADNMRRSTELDPGSIKAFVNLSRIENDRVDYEAALRAAEAAVALDAQDPTALLLHGRSLRNLGRTDEAIESFEASLTADPDNGDAQNLYGLTLLAQGRDSEAVTAIGRAAELLPEVAYIRNNLGMALEHAGRGVEAVAAYREAVGLDPEHAKAVANLERLEPTVVAAGGPLE